MWESLIGLQGRGFGRAEPSPGGGLTLASCVPNPTRCPGIPRGTEAGVRVWECVAVCGVLHLMWVKRARAGVGGVVRSLAVGPLRALSCGARLHD